MVLLNGGDAWHYRRSCRGSNCVQSLTEITEIAGTSGIAAAIRDKGEISEA